MSEYSGKLAGFLKAEGVRAEHLRFTQSTHSVAEAAAAVGAQADDFVKSICLLDKGGQLMVAIVKGEDRVDLNKVKVIAGTEGKPRPASPEEILSLTGYPCGGTPPFGFPAKFLMDNRVFEKQLVYAGGGDAQSLVKASPQEIARVNGATVCEIRK